MKGFNCAVAAIAIALGGTACASSATGPSGGGNGVLTGGIHILGGPAVSVTAPIHYAAGLVKITDSDGTVTQQNVADGKLYVFHIKAGHYRLVVNMGSFNCTKNVTVRANTETRADLECQVK